MTTKQSNPKDICGTAKAPMSTVSAPVLAEMGVAMLEGACKYGRHNYREVGIRASVYYDATMRHLMAWWEGEDLDPDSGLSHVTKAIVSLAVLRDAMINDKVDDDRPPSCKPFYEELNAKAAAIIERYKDRNPRHYTIGDTKLRKAGIDDPAPTFGATPSGFTPWHGRYVVPGEIPTTIVEVIFRSGDHQFAAVGDLFWRWESSSRCGGDIIGYRLARTREPD